MAVLLLTHGLDSSYSTSLCGNEPTYLPDTLLRAVRL
jgi:hypothetical protein